MSEEIKYFPTKKIKTADLIPYARNSRTHPDEQINQIASSIKEFGFTNPVIVDKDNGVIAGHGRIMAAKKLGIKELPCIIADGWTDAQKKAYVIADNKLALNAGWDNQMLAVEFEELKELGFDMTLTGFTLEEIGQLSPQVIKGLTDEDDVPDAPEKPKTVLGDVWILGNHRLMCGDSTSIDAVEKLMGGQKADLVVTDPPYNVDYEGKTEDALKIQNDKMGDEEFYKFLYDVYTVCFSIMRDGAPIYVFHPDKQAVPFTQSFKEAGLHFAQYCVWIKHHFVMGRMDYHAQHEPIIYGWKQGASHTWQSDRKQTSVWNFDRPMSNRLHPTMKPVDLIEYPIQNSSRKSDVVFEPFGGSGSTLIACEKTKRLARLMELDPKYCDVIIKRWQDFTGKKAVHAETGKEYDVITA